MVAALDIADAGFPVHLVEASDHLGGRVAELNRTFPDLEPVAEWLPALVDRVQRHPNITVYLNSRVTHITGFVGNFEATVNGVGEPLKVGAIVIATGYNVFDPRRKPEFGYGVYPQVVTTLELEHRLASGDLAVNGKTPKDVVFVKCVGSRDQQLGRPYCSRVCCMISAKQAQLVRQALPDARVTVFYMDVRTFGKRGEEFYDEARRAGVRYRRGNVSEIYRRGDRVVVRVEDTLLGRTLEHEADLVVLAVGMEPRPEGRAASLSHPLALGWGKHAPPPPFPLPLSRRLLPGGPPETPPGGYGGGWGLPGGLLPGAKGHSGDRRAGEGGGGLGPHPADAGRRPDGGGDGRGGPGPLRRVRDVCGNLPLRRAGAGPLLGRLAGERRPLQGLRRLRGHLSVQGDPSPALHARPDPGPGGSAGGVVKGERSDLQWVSSGRLQWRLDWLGRVEM